MTSSQSQPTSSPNSIELIIAELRGKLDLTSKEIADVLWLALEFQKFEASSLEKKPKLDNFEPSNLQFNPDNRLKKSASSNQSSTSSSTDKDRLKSVETNKRKGESKEAEEEKTASVYSSFDSEESSGLRIDLPDAPSIREPLTLARAFRPLMRRVPTGRKFIIDEAATVQRIAEERICIPVLKAEPEPWLDLALVIDESHSMLIWGHTIRELKQMFKNYGIFRDIRVWGLQPDEAGENLQLFSRLGSDKRLAKPQEIIDPTGRRLILIVSDCVSNIWRKGIMFPVLNAWTQKQPLAILQMLPEWMWRRTALDLGTAVGFKSSIMGIPNQQLSLHKPLRRSRRIGFKVEERSKIPVITLTLNREYANQWSQMLIGKADALVPGYLLPPELKEENIHPLLQREQNAVNNIDAAARVDRFRNTASPLARQLAGLLAASPVINLPVVRLIRSSLLPKSTQIQVAEVFLGGLLRPQEKSLEKIEEIEEEINKVIDNPDLVEYEFVDDSEQDINPKIRDLFLEDAPVNDSVDVVNAVSRYIAEQLGVSMREFMGLLKAPQEAEEKQREDTIKPFAQITAKILRNLGEKYAEFADELEGKGSVEQKAENLENAIAALNAALSIRTRQAFPIDWAITQNNLGLAYLNRIKGEKAQNLEHAYTSFKSAIEIVESLRSEILSGDEAKRKHAEEWNKTYRSMIEVCLELGRTNEAIEYVERSKTRNLVELILERDLTTIFPPNVASKLEELRDKISIGQYKIQNGTAEDPKSLAQNLQQLRQQRQELQDRYLPVGSGFRFDQFQPTLARRTAIIEWYITGKKILAFVVKPNGQKLTVWQSQPEDREALINWVNKYLQDYYYTRKNEWQYKLDERLKLLSKILHIESILDQIPEEQYDRLILIPHRFLHLLPLHALPVGESYLLDRFSQGVGYAPSCQLLQQVQQRERPNFQSLFAVQNPTGDLKFTDQEVNSILSLFPDHQVLSNSHATKVALDRATLQLQEADYLHFSCHGSFNPNSPFLLLADAKVKSIPTDANPKQYLEISEGFIDLNKCLTLENLFERSFDLKKCRLVVLSACETGLIDFTNDSDEYIGLPSGFLYAGSSSVVSSLWTVDDMSTAYLIIKFLQNLKAAFDGGEDVSVAVALNQAQHWLRNITWEDLNKWANDLQLDSSNNRQIERSMRQMSEIVAKNARSKNIDKKPFQSPYHWAGFTAIGQ